MAVQLDKGVQNLAVAEKEAAEWRILVSSFNMECPPVWITGYIETLPSYTLRKFESVSHYLSNRLQQREYKLPLAYSGDIQGTPVPEEDNFKVEDVDAGGKYETILGFEEWLCIQICVGSLAFVLKEVVRSRRILGNCSTELHRNKSWIPEGRWKTMDRLLRATQLCVDFTEVTRELAIAKKKRLATLKKEHDVLESKVGIIRQQLQEVKNSAGAYYLKGRVAALLGCAHDISLEWYRMAVKANPEFYLWHQTLYDKLKQRRASGSNSFKPCSEELNICQKAHELAPKNMKIIMDWATVKVQHLRWRLNERSSEPVQDSNTELETILPLLREVAAHGGGNSRYAMLAKLKIAELYTSRGLPQRIAEAKEIFMDCFKKWPKISMVLHKVANFFRDHAGDPKVAQNIYEETLKCNPQNYPCLMDYLKLQGKTVKNYREMVDIIDRCLPVTRDSVRIVNLLIIRGQALWLNKKTIFDACESWVEAITNFENLASNVSDGLTSNYSHVFGRIEMPLQEVCFIFKQVCRRMKMNGNKKIQEFLKTLEKAKQDHRRPSQKPNFSGGRPGMKSADASGKQFAGAPGKKSADISGKKSAGAPGKKSAGAPGKKSAAASEKKFAAAPEKKFADAPGKKSAGAPGKKSADFSEKKFAAALEKKSADAPGKKSFIHPPIGQGTKSVHLRKRKGGTDVYNEFLDQMDHRKSAKKCKFVFIM